MTPGSDELLLPQSTLEEIAAADEVHDLNFIFRLQHNPFPLTTTHHVMIHFDRDLFGFEVKTGD